MAEEITIRSRNKATVQAELREFMLSQCDEDIRDLFTMHFYTLEPLLIQLIREIKALRKV